MQKADAVREHTVSTVDPVELGPDELESTHADLAEILGVLAHEFRNPLASLQGCAQTLLDRGDALRPDVREQMTEVIVKHAKRLDWLVRAAATFGGAGGRTEAEEVALSDVLAEAREFAGAGGDPSGAATVYGNERRFQLAIEAVLLALGDAVSLRVLPPGDRVEISSSQRDLSVSGRRWKLHLASVVLREAGGSIHVIVSSHGTTVTMRFPRMEKR